MSINSTRNREMIAKGYAKLAKCTFTYSDGTEYVRPTTIKMIAKEEKLVFPGKCKPTQR